MPAAACPATAPSTAPPPVVAAQQAAADRGEREQRDHQAGGQTDAAAEHAADPGRRLVLLDDLDLAVVAALDHRRVVGVDQAGLGVQVLDGVVVGLGVVDVAYTPT